MSDITLEKTHALLEQLAEYVMTEIPVIKQDIADLKQDVSTLKQDVSILKQDVFILKQDVSVLKQDVSGLKSKTNMILDILDSQGKQIDTVLIEQKAISATLTCHEDRLGDLEEHVFGARVREDKEDYKDKSLGEN